MSELAHQRFGKYLLLSRIAQGGMAELYQAKLVGDEGFEKLIAIKKILPHLAEETSLVTAFIDEAKLAAFLQHPNIVQIYDFGSVNSTYYIAMEYLYGKDLKLITNRCKEMDLPISIENALYIATQICAGLDYAHKLKDFQGKPLNIIHRDIGPHNIFITYDGQVKIIDFGIAKAAIQNTKTQDGSIKGKMAYMSPEQAQGEPIDHRSDIFAMGILLYEMVTHERMFEGDAFSVLAKVREVDYIPAGTVNKALPGELCGIIDKALAKDREQRYQSAEEMLTDLEKYMHGLSINPSYRNLSQYVKELYGEEAKSELEAIRKITDADSMTSSGAGETARPKIEKTMVLAEDELPSQRKRRIPLFASYALILIAVGFLVTLVFVKNPGSFFNTSKGTSYSKVSGDDSIPERSNNIQPLPVRVKVNANALKESSLSDDVTQSVQTVTYSPKLKEGIKLLEEEKFSEASVLFEDILKTEPINDKMVSNLYSQALIGQASKISGNEPKKARALLLKAVKLIPGSAQGHYFLGRIYTRQKDFTSAVASYQTAIELNPQMPNAYFNLGYVYTIKKDYARAQDMFSRVVDLSPPFLDEALFNLAIVQRKMGNIQDCIKNLEQAVTVNPENKQAKRLLQTLKQKQKKQG
jgi:serine/threonine protein kinase